MRSIAYWAVCLICLSSGVACDIGRLSEDELQFSTASAYNRVFNAMKIGGAEAGAEDFGLDLPQITSIIDQPAVYVPPIKPIAPAFPVFKIGPQLTEPKVVIAGAAGLARGYDPNPPSFFFEPTALEAGPSGDADDALGRPKPIIYEKRWRLSRRRDAPGSLWSGRPDTQRKVEGYLYAFGGEEDPRLLVAGGARQLRSEPANPRDKVDLVGTLSLQLLGAPEAHLASPAALGGVLAAFRSAAEAAPAAARGLAEKIGDVLQFREEAVQFERGLLKADPNEFGHLVGFEKRLECLAKPGCSYEELVAGEAARGENAHLASGFFSQIFADSGAISEGQGAQLGPEKPAHLAASNAAFDETLASICDGLAAAPAQLGCAVARARALAAGQFTKTDNRTLNFVMRLLREWEARPDGFEAKVDDVLRVLAGHRPANSEVRFPAADALAGDIFAPDAKLRQLMASSPQPKHLAAEFAEFVEARLAHDGFLDNIFGRFGSQPAMSGYGSQAPLTSGATSGLGTFLGSGLGSSLGGNLGYELGGPLGGMLGSAAGASLGSGGAAPLLPTLGASAGGALGAQLGGGGLTSALTGALGQTLGSGGTYGLGNTLGAALGSQLGGGPGTMLGTLGGILGAGVGSSLFGRGGGLLGSLFGQPANSQPFSNQFPYASAEMTQPSFLGRLGSLFSRNLEERQMVDRYLEHLADQFVEANGNK